MLAPKHARTLGRSLRTHRKVLVALGCDFVRIDLQTLRCRRQLEIALEIRIHGGGRMRIALASRGERDDSDWNDRPLNEPAHMSSWNDLVRMRMHTTDVDWNWHAK